MRVGEPRVWRSRGGEKQCSGAQGAKGVRSTLKLASVTMGVRWHVRVWVIVYSACAYCTGQPMSQHEKEKKTFYQQVLKLRANEASAQGLQNAL